MIKSWGEIQERFDAIKDNKPRASKKLNELGDILSSAYMHNPDEASEMWQYIINLNIADDITYSKFYIAQVFNKLADRMKPEDVVTFLSMNPERVHLMILYGYESGGGTLWHCLDTLIKGSINIDDVDGVIRCIEYFYEKFGGIQSGLDEITRTAGNSVKICAEYINKGEHDDTARSIIDKLSKSDNEEINNYIEIIKTINGLGDSFDFDRLFDIAIENKYSNEFFELLWAARDEIDEDKLRDKWTEYIQNCDEEDWIPSGHISEDEKDYENSKLKFYVDLEKEADEILERYFGSARLWDVEKGVIWAWIEEEDWERFVKYISQAVMATSDDPFEWSDLKCELGNYMDAVLYDDSIDSTDSYERSYRELMKGRTDDFAEALSKVSAITVGCDAHDSFHELIKNFIQKQSGNLDALNAAGFDEEVETRGVEERLKDYVHEFLASGELIHVDRGIKYSLIMDELHDELYGSGGGNQVTINIDVSGIIAKALGIELDDADDEINESLEQHYRLASDDEIAEFYFKHCPDDYFMRRDLLSACVKKGDVNRAVELIDMMVETEEYEEYEELNGWGRQNMLTLGYLIDDYEYDKEYRWDSEDITDEMRETVKQLVYRMLPHLSEKSREELKEKWLFKIEPQSEDSDDYINRLLEDAIVYTTFPKPRGKGGAQNVNRMSDEFIHCFERLSKMGRLDVVAEIMSKFASVKDVLKPVKFDRWMLFMVRGLRSGDMIKLYRTNKSIFEAWLDNDNLSDGDIKRVAEGIADGCTREEIMDFRNLVVSRKGKIDGLDSCF
ncbi:MAG: hypothetical protein K6F41_03825 [Lachnospira sp.]|nr:hypothetical protein [Lachnospira sp.]